MQGVMANSKAHQYDQIIIEFLQNRGHLVVVTPDAQFCALVRRTLSRHICLNPDMYSTHAEVDQVVRILRTLCARYSVILFLERLIHGNDMGFMVAQIKQAFPEVKLIVISQETEKDKLILLHEAGADNLITKPISVNGLVEKMAFTIKPMGKFGQMIDQARSFLAQNNPQQALIICRQALELKPESAAAYLVSGDAYLAMRNYDRASQNYQKARNSAGLYLAPLQKLADLCALRGDKDGRLHYLGELDHLSPLNMERKLKMGELFLEKGDTKRAREFFEASVIIATREARTFVSEIANRIASVYAKSDPREAENFLRRALELKGDLLSSDDLEIFNRLGISLRNQGKWREALEEYQRALRIAPKNENIYYNMGMACVEGKDFARAQDFMKKALHLNAHLPENSANVACNIGAVFCRAGNRDMGIPLLRTALLLDPSHGPAQQMLQALGVTLSPEDNSPSSAS